MSHHLIPDPHHRRTARRRALAYLVGSSSLVTHLLAAVAGWQLCRACRWWSGHVVSHNCEEET